MILCKTLFFSNLKLIIFLKYQIELEYIYICFFPVVIIFLKYQIELEYIYIFFFPVVAIHGTTLLPTLPHLDF